MPDDADIQDIFSANRSWAEGVEADQPGAFARSAQGQAPTFLWVGCADSRVPVERLSGLGPGEVFVVRNVANVVAADDLGAMAAIDYAIGTLRVRHAVVCGHTHCGGVAAAMGDKPAGPVGDWIAGINELWQQARTNLAKADPETQHQRLCELNVLHQARALANTGAVRAAWARGQALTVHGWLFDIASGLLQDLGRSYSSPADLAN